jgi:hypothetical protein
VILRQGLATFFKLPCTSTNIYENFAEDVDSLPSRDEPIRKIADY